MNESHPKKSFYNSRKNLIISGMKKVVVTYTGDACVFPFSYRGREYTGCITKDRERAWCATRINSYNQIVKWGFCNPDWGENKTYPLF